MIRLQNEFRKFYTNYMVQIYHEKSRALYIMKNMIVIFCDN